MALARVSHCRPSMRTPADSVQGVWCGPCGWVCPCPVSLVNGIHPSSSCAGLELVIQSWARQCGGQPRDGHPVACPQQEPKEPSPCRALPCERTPLPIPRILDPSGPESGVALSRAHLMISKKRKHSAIRARPAKSVVRSPRPPSRNPWESTNCDHPGVSLIACQVHHPSRA